MNYYPPILNYVNFFYSILGSLLKKLSKSWVWYATCTCIVIIHKQYIYMVKLLSIIWIIFTFVRSSTTFKLLREAVYLIRLQHPHTKRFCMFQQHFAETFAHWINKNVFTQTESFLVKQNAMLALPHVLTCMNLFEITTLLFTLIYQMLSYNTKHSVSLSYSFVWCPSKVNYANDFWQKKFWMCLKLFDAFFVWLVKIVLYLYHVKILFETNSSKMFC